MLDPVFPIAVLLAVVNRAIVDYLAAPIKQHYPNHDTWYLVYVAFVIGGVIGWLSGVNLFGGIETMAPITGRILTACCIGGGANLLHDIAKRRADPLPSTEDYDDVPEM